MLIRKQYSYEQFCLDVNTLVQKMLLDKYQPEAIVSIARGGMTLGHFLSQRLNIRDIYTIQSSLYTDTEKNIQHYIGDIPSLSKYRKILIVDDIVDSGETLKKVVEVLSKNFLELESKSITLFYKKTAIIQADYSLHVADSWIDFFWEKS